MRPHDDFAEPNCLGWACCLSFCPGFWLISTRAAPAIRRVPLPCFDSHLRMQSLLYCALNRHRIAPDPGDYGLCLARAMHVERPGPITLAADANSPFLDGFPLLPHLSQDDVSQDDAHKLDPAYFYRDLEGVYKMGNTKSPDRYRAFANPTPCAARPSVRRDETLTRWWDMGWFGDFRRKLALARHTTAPGVHCLTHHVPAGKSETTLPERRLANTLGMTHPRITFRGRRAARHDEQTHIQMSQG